MPRRVSDPTDLGRQLRARALEPAERSSRNPVGHRRSAGAKQARAPAREAARAPKLPRLLFRCHDGGNALRMHIDAHACGCACMVGHRAVTRARERVCACPRNIPTRGCKQDESAHVCMRASTCRVVRLTPRPRAALLRKVQFRNVCGSEPCVRYARCAEHAAVVSASVPPESYCGACYGLEFFPPLAQVCTLNVAVCML